VGHRSQGWSEECALSTCIGGNVSHSPQYGPFGAHSSWDCGLGMDGSGQKHVAKFLVLLWEFKLAAWGKVN
jgi:hypothetical protein